MDLLKKIGFIVVFLLTLSQAMGNSTFQFGQKLFVIENHEDEQPVNEALSIEFDEPEDQYSTITYMACTCYLIIEQRIVEQECHFRKSFNLTFWQPPKKA